MLREPAEPSASASEPKQSGSFRYLQGMLEAGEGGKTPANLPHLPHTPSGALKSSAPPPLLCDPPPPPPRAASQPSAPARLLRAFPHPSLPIPTPPLVVAPPPPNLVPSRSAGGPGSWVQPTPRRSEVLFSDLCTGLMPLALRLSGERPGSSGPRNLKPTSSKLGAPLSGLQGLPECTRCGHGIV